MPVDYSRCLRAVRGGKQRVGVTSIPLRDRHDLVVVAFAAACLAGPAGASTLPSGFAETTAFSGLTNPTVVRFAADGRVFVAEKSGLIKVFSSLSDTTPTTFADLRTKVHNFWDRGLLGMALHPELPGQPLRLRALRARRRDRRHGTPLGHRRRQLGPVPEPAGPDGRRLCGLRAAVAAAGRRRRHDRCGAGADRGLVPAVSEPFGRLARVRGRRRALRDRRRRRELQLHGLRPGRQSRQPMRRPAGRTGHRARVRRPPRAARCAARTCARPPIPPASTGPCCA